MAISKIATPDGTEHAIKDAAVREILEDIVPNNASKTNKLGTQADFVNLYGVTEIPSNADLNNYKTPGSYYVDTAAIASTLKNTPASNMQAFKLTVEARRPAGTNADKTIEQRITCNNTGSVEFYVRHLAAGSSTWGAWYRLMTNADISRLSIDRLVAGSSGSSSASSAGNACYIDVPAGKAGATFLMIAGEFNMSTTVTPYTIAFGGGQVTASPTASNPGFGPLTIIKQTYGESSTNENYRSRIHFVREYIKDPITFRFHAISQISNDKGNTWSINSQVKFINFQMIRLPVAYENYEMLTEIPPYFPAS